MQGLHELANSYYKHATKGQNLNYQCFSVNLKEEIEGAEAVSGGSEYSHLSWSIRKKIIQVAKFCNLPSGLQGQKM